MTWDYAESEYKKQAEADTLWRLERVILYGLRGEKLKRDELAAHIDRLRIPEDRRAFLELLLWNKTF